MKTEICDHCGKQNDRADYANWCSKCALESETERKAIEAKRMKEFQDHMLHRPR